ncbi:MAG: hypothetical protein JNM42_17175 [Propionivibrio sp.]|uniref:hypothetical protein n=1 Tax=Propionivibrio sp. TaxID=2212460 RepID=UPI001A5036C2|nr:hypothetical protein [Propionivibrio sp.]MBL8416164.1 hypothetical protein [Propionivibrio sp.]
MKTQSTIPASLFHQFVSLFLVTMTLIFLTVPYTLSRHPGEFLPAGSTQAFSTLSK